MENINCEKNLQWFCKAWGEADSWVTAMRRSGCGCGWGRRRLRACGSAHTMALTGRGRVLTCQEDNISNTNALLFWKRMSSELCLEVSSAWK
jgi:hypothetical protein